jgi:DNA repair exonuclease SbcCD ATPase subunit
VKDDAHKKATIESIRKVQQSSNPYYKQLQGLESQTNTYAEQLDNLAKEVNPHDTKEIQAEINKNVESKTSIEAALVVKFQEVSDIDTLLDLVGIFRSSVVRRSVAEIEAGTNDLLTKHFDGEIRISLKVEASDKLDVSIQKNGNECVYAQLSKGQRQLLKLCFGVIVMRLVSRHLGVKFNAIFFDEALDGLDDQFKIKAYNLLETLGLEYESVFVVEHNENLKTMFTNQVEVRLESGNSVLYEQT